MQAFVAFLNRLVREEEGQDMVEYALILGLVSIVAVGAVHYDRYLSQVNLDERSEARSAKRPEFRSGFQSSTD